MKSYVLSFAHQIPHATTQDVILIQRLKADWQFGKLNLPGGSIHDGEPVEKAACRELQEETGIVASLADTKMLGVMCGEDWEVYICFCPYRYRYGVARQEPRTMSDEGKIISMNWREAMNDHRLIPNLRIIIPLCQSRIDGWKLTPGRHDWEWITNLSLIDGD